MAQKHTQKRKKAKASTAEVINLHPIVQARNRPVGIMAE